MEELVESSVGGLDGADGDGGAGGGCAHHNRCLRMNAAFAGSV